MWSSSSSATNTFTSSKYRGALDKIILRGLLDHLGSDDLPCFCLHEISARSCLQPGRGADRRLWHLLCPPEKFTNGGSQGGFLCTCIRRRKAIRISVEIHIC